MGRCKVCNFSDDTDQHNGNKMLDHDTCLECTEEIGETMASYYWEDMDSDDLSWLFNKKEDQLICEIEKIRTMKYEMWQVTLDGKVIVEQNRDPEHAACRALQEMGLTGPVSFKHKGSKTISSTKDIEEGAKWMVSEPSDRSAAYIRYKEFRPGTFSMGDSDPQHKDADPSPEFLKRPGPPPWDV
jgi:hypothetical protein